MTSAMELSSKTGWSFVSAQKSNKFAIILNAQFLLLHNFKNATAYHLGRHEASSPSIKELHGSAQSPKDRLVENVKQYKNDFAEKRT